jgi:hypothetical protein
LADAVGHCSKELVTHAVPEVVVDRLEVIEIDEEHRRLGREPTVEKQESLDTVDDEGSVRKSGEGIRLAWKAISS